MRIKTSNEDGQFFITISENGDNINAVGNTPKEAMQALLERVKEALADDESNLIKAKECGIELNEAEDTHYFFSTIKRTKKMLQCVENKLKKLN